MNKLLNFYERVSNWNAKRYDQVFDKPLAMSLLREEYTEWLEAETDVDKLDALCDTAFVAMGVLWKSDPDLAECQFANDQSMELTNGLVDMNELWPAYFVSTYLDVFEHSNGYPITSFCFNVFWACYVQMLAMGLTEDQVFEALNIVCDSNDSKSIQKTASNVKANINKGEFFKAPEPRLTRLLEQRNERIN